MSDDEGLARTPREHPSVTVIGVTSTEVVSTKSYVVPRSWWFDIFLVIGFAATTGLLATGHLLRLDVEVSDWCGDHQPAAMHWLARLGNLLGQGGVLTLACIALAVFWIWRRHTIRPIGPVVMAFALTSVTLTVLKGVTDRPAPLTQVTPAMPHPEELGAGGVSYPSGHLVNALVWYGVLALLLSPWLSSRWRWALRVIPPVVLSITTVYLQFHWLSDTVAGLLLGSLLWRLIGRITWDEVPLPGWMARRGWAGPAGLR